MNEATIQRLNAINRDFYRITATEFDQTRGQAWSGWHQLVPYLAPLRSVLDIGCGNGRFGVFWGQQINADGMYGYYGLDNNLTLLQAATVALQAYPRLQAHLIGYDLLETPRITPFVAAQQFDLVVLFGVVHHIAGYANRQRVLKAAADSVKSGGYLVFAIWRFYEYERFRGRIVAWDETWEVEPNDYLLDWRRGQSALRYCHYVDDVELQALITATGLETITTYRADGFTRTVNCYTILRKS